MSLLFDANLSPKLPRRLADLFPLAKHVEENGLESTDASIWTFALERNLVIVTKDDDFRARALLLAPPGKVILVGLGNCETNAVEVLFRTEINRVLEFLQSEVETLLGASVNGNASIHIRAPEILVDSAPAEFARA